MSGNARSGRWRQPDKPRQRQGKPERPDDLTPVEAAFWTRVIDVANHLEARDTPLAVALCRTWALYQAALSEAADDPTSAMRRNSVASYQSQFERLCKLAQIDPLGRSRIGTPPTEEEDPLSEFGVVA